MRVSDLKKRIPYWMIVILVVLSFAVVSQPAVIFAEDEPISEMPEEQQTDHNAVPGEYELIAENSDVALYAEMVYGNFAFKDKISGKTWFSVPQDLENDTISKGIRRADIRSQLIVGYIDMNSEAVSAFESTVNSQSGSVSNEMVKVSRISDGIRVEFEFLDQSFLIPVEYKMVGSSLSASIVVSDIRQTGSMKITSIRLLPYMVSAGENADGYMFVPQGSGARIDLNNGKYLYSQYEQPVFGRDAGISLNEAEEKTNNVIMPVFGIKIGNNALTGIIVSGEANSFIAANVAGGRIGYNSVHPKFVMSIMDKTTLFETDYFNLRTIYKTEPEPRTLDRYEVRYFSASGDKASYAGMAEIYRDYLVSNSHLKSAPKEPSLYIDLLGAIDKPASFLGIPYVKMTALTTFDQAKEIAEDLKEKGVGDITMRLTGWTNSGVRNKKITAKASPLRVLGGRSAYDSLASYMAAEDNDLIHNVDMFNFRRTGNSVSKLRDAAASIFHTRTLRYDFMLSVFVPSLKTKPWFLLKPSSLPGLSEKFARSYEKLGGDYVSLDFLGENIYSDFGKNGTQREEAAGIYAEVMENFTERNIRIAVDSGNAYTLANADRIFGLPSKSNDHMIFDGSVPFAQIVLHGYKAYSIEDMNREIDPRVSFLRCIETGSDLYFRGMFSSSDILSDTNYAKFYSYEYDNWSKTAADMYTEYAGVHEKLYDKIITDHRKLAESVFVTVFSDGTQIYVNYGDKTYNADGVSVDAKDYYVKEGGDR